MAVLGFVKFQVCLKSLNISFKPEFVNPRFETPKKQNVFNFQLTFTAIVVFILCFCRTHSSETFSLEIISQLLLFDDEHQKKF